MMIHPANSFALTLQPFSKSASKYHHSQALIDELAGAEKGKALQAYAGL